VRELNLIGIGAGDPEDLTMKAVKALNRSDVLFFPSKKADGGALLRARYEICRRFVEREDQRIVEIDDPERGASGYDHLGTVERWYDLRLAAWEEAVGTHLGDEEVGAFLVWGDPTLYDGTLRVLEAVRARGTLDFEMEVLPGISAVQALAASHKVTLNQIGGSLLITTGRELKQGWPVGVSDVVVMLDPHCSFNELDEQVSTMIYWGAFLGMPEQILVSGLIAECGEGIERARARARERHGWIFDTYLLRRVRHR
jgi:precorrin-6A synthase